MIIFFGPAGSGKSVQGQLLAAADGWVWLSTGKILRETNDPSILDEIEKGNLISSEIMYGLVEKALDCNTETEHIVLDGFPRKREQAEWLVAHSTNKKRSIELGIIVDVPTEEITARMLARGRADDTPEAIQERLRIYHEEMEPILEYLSQQNIPMVHIDGSAPIDEVHERVLNVVRAANLI